MTRRHIIQQRAWDDIEAAAQFLADWAGAHHVDQFRVELSKVIRTLCAYPGIGTPCPDTPLGLKDLRRTHLRRYRHLIFYTADGAAVRIIRVLHPKRDLESELAE